MFVYISEYPKNFSTRFVRPVAEFFGISKEFSEKIEEFISSKLNSRKRTVIVRINRSDVWNLDETLSYIICESLKQFKKRTFGYPIVDQSDLPKEMRFSNRTSNESFQYDLFADEGLDKIISSMDQKNWDYILDQMIWSFEQLSYAEEPSFWEETPNITLNEDGLVVSNLGKFNKKESESYHNRIYSGLILFGKYFRNLWT